MSREIKFRAWDGKKMLPNRTVFNGADWDCERDAATGNPIMQYTGLKDRNGKEIYEGLDDDYLAETLEHEGYLSLLPL